MHTYLVNCFLLYDFSANGTIFSSLLQTFFSILRKGSGDIFQEINAICKNGGYIETPKYNNEEMHKWSNGNAMRFFAANDRPSATRFIFLNEYGNNEDINNFAFGGYISKLQDCVVRRRIEEPVCNYGKTKSSRGGSELIVTNKSKKRIIKKLHRNTKRASRIKKGKRSKKVKIVKKGNTRRR